MRKTKIVATIGPASSSVLVLTDLIKSGVDVARLNFSHGTHESHYEIIQNIREAEKNAGREIAIMMDTMGPEIRTGKFKDQKAFLVQGSEVIVTPDDLLGDEKKFSVTYDYICTDLKPGD
ncbi:MAG: pyruvate kinase, partial [Eubacteriales bacterium]|nr:pyruvate kinase [Eubacteriales bacterium]